MTDDGVTVERVHAELRARELTVATAESLTGGLLAAQLTAGEGASATFLGGVVSYATEVKVSVLGVPQQVVDEHGVVSGECARAMADGVRALVGASYAVSTTGVAGPDTQEGKPVGTVFVGVAGPDRTAVTELDLGGARSDIQRGSVAAAVSALAAMLGIGPELGADATDDGPDQEE